MERGKRMFLILSLVFSGLILSNIVVHSESPAPTDAAKKIISQIEILGNEEYENLTLIPVKGTGNSLVIPIKSLDEVIGTETFVIKEVNSSGNVNELTVVNKSDNFVFIMAGEIVAGAKQDRILQEDVLIPPKSGSKKIKAYCVEHGRWQAQTDKFYSRKQTANIATRQAAKSEKSQLRVWDSVSKTNSKMGTRSETGSLSEVFNSEKFSKDKKAFQDYFKNCRSQYPQATGVIILINGKVMAADIFADTKMLGQYWSKLLDSYIIEGISSKNRPVNSNFSDVRLFLGSVQNAKITTHAGQGVGNNVNIESSDITASGLLYDNNLIHMDIFPRLKDSSHATKGGMVPPGQRMNR